MAVLVSHDDDGSSAWVAAAENFWLFHSAVKESNEMESFGSQRRHLVLMR
ncbi:conserved hypothetical protein [Ricinus communis]|uniref:Uncharacterized protein n=1 Tax=Ricinus communis TaxID=3988 RepID=B9RC78_RICCO|nr:conserved hypothetical protein [Ricinus communis]